MSDHEKALNRQWPVGESEMARRIRAIEPNETPLGPIEKWPVSLRNTLDLILPSGVQIVLFWGPQSIAFYNDAYVPTIGNKHPKALGRPAAENWTELWEDLEPLLNSVRTTGQTITAKDRPFYIERHGYGEQVFFDISYSAVRDEAGEVGGVLCIVNETTSSVVANRHLREREERQRFLLELWDRMRAESDANAVISAAARMLGERLKASRVVFAEIDESSGTANVQSSWAADVAPPDSGTFRSEDFTGPLLDDLRAGRTVRFNDVGVTPHARSDLAALAAIGVKAGLSVPLIVAGHLVASLSVHQDEPREWNEAEVALVEEIAGRLWAAVWRARAETRLHESEQRFRMMAENISQLAWTSDALGEINWFNRRWLEYTGKTFEETRGWLWKDVVHPDHVDRVVEGLMLSRATGEPWEDTFLLRDKNGKYRWFLSRAVPIRNEAGAVTRWFGTNTDITAEREADAAGARLAAIVQSSDDAIISKDLNGTITSWNEGAQNVFGYAADEAIGRSITMLIPSDRQEEERGILEKLKKGERIQHFETKRQRKDGSTFDISLTISPVKDRTGRIIGASKIGRDITERKDAQEIQSLLIDELNHRVKNTLASVQAIAHQTLRRTQNPADFVSSFSGRIQSLARVHTLLAAATWRSADLREVVRDQLLHGAVDKARITTSGPPLQLGPQSALHVAMMLHELGTNAVKYGALSEAGGRVEINWSLENNILHLRWSETGGPPVRISGKRGFGMTLIEQSAKGSGGAAHMSVSANGVVWEITLPQPHHSANENTAQAGKAAAEGTNNPSTPQGRLASQRFLIVEDEPLVALDLEYTLASAGAEVVASITSIADALKFIGNEKIDAALLDCNLRGLPVDEVAEALRRHNVPFVFVSGYSRESVPKAFNEVPLIKKPFAVSELLEAAGRLVQSDAGGRRFGNRVKELGAH